jgi:hypothetical protein
MVRQPWGGRPDKATLLRMKWAAALVSAVAFIGSLGAVVYANPGSRSVLQAANQVQSISMPSSASASASQAAGTDASGRQRQAPAVPITRTKGS